MENDEYNGWTNYPTWNVALWIDNEESFQEDAKMIMKEDHEHNCEYWDAMRSWVEDVVVGIEKIEGCACDLGGWALGQVNWKEVCDAYMDKD